MHPTIEDYLEHLRLEGRSETARGYRTGLQQYSDWIGQRGKDPLTATADDLRAFQLYLARNYISKRGKHLGKGTQATRISGIKSFHDWLERRNQVVVNVARDLKVPVTPQRMVLKDYLTLQEATACIQTQAAIAAAYPEGCHKWAQETRTLALVCLALATGRRREGLRTLRLTDADFTRNELRCEKEKGKAGRVLPVTGWAMAILRIYIEKARPVLDWWGDNPWLFVGDHSPQLGRESVAQLVRTLHAATCERNPDLDELPGKNITPHSLRVSFATMLFQGGCNIRSINELMMHETLSTTARYTHVPLEDLRKACRQAHPRA